MSGGAFVGRGSATTAFPMIFQPDPHAPHHGDKVWPTGLTREKAEEVDCYLIDNTRVVGLITMWQQEARNRDRALETKTA